MKFIDRKTGKIYRGELRLMLGGNPCEECAGDGFSLCGRLPNCKVSEMHRIIWVDVARERYDLKNDPDDIYYG